MTGFFNVHNWVFQMAPRKNYTPEQMEKAVQNGEIVAVAAKQFGVPRVTHAYHEIHAVFVISVTIHAV